MIKIEILFKEVANLYGDAGNVFYLEQALKNMLKKDEYKIIYTSLNDKIQFVDKENNISFVYLGSHLESKAEIILDKLRKYEKDIRASIKEGMYFLVTGNSFDLFGKYIILDKRYMDKNFENIKSNKNTVEYFNSGIYEDEKLVDINVDKIDEKYLQKGLSFYDTIAVTNMLIRFNGFTLGKTKLNINNNNNNSKKETQIFGYKSTFTQSYGKVDKENIFVEVTNGVGINENINIEGVRINNFISTYMLGPILTLNPDLLKEIFFNLGIIKNMDEKIYIEEEMKNANNKLVNIAKNK